MNYGSLCSGVGGLDLAVEAVFGAEPAWHSEVDKDASKVLANHWDVPNLGDLTTVDWETAKPVDLICTGPPCQPVSVAGKRKGESDERWLWPDVLRAVGQVRPGIVVLENPPGIAPWLGGIIAELAQLGYVGRYGRLRASDVGACHRRERVFAVAYASREPGWNEQVGERGGSGAAAAADVGEGLATDTEACRWWPARWDNGIRAAERGEGSPADADGEGWGWKNGWWRPCCSPDRDGHRSEPGRTGGPDFPWGRYQPAIDRHGQVLGRPAPWPVVEGTRSLSGAFTEWMMMMPEGWLKGVSNTAQKRLCGNAVMPLQAITALTHLSEVLG